MTQNTIKGMLLSICCFLILNPNLGAQAIFLDTVRFVQTFQLPFKSDLPQQTTQFPFKFSGFKDNDTLVDLDFYLNLKSYYTNSNSVTLISPFGGRATVMTTNSCPNQYGEDIEVVFNDQAYDISLWNTFQVNSPAYFSCVSNSPSIGYYNQGHISGGPDDGKKYTVGQMRPQGDFLKSFKGTKLDLSTDDYKIIISSNNIDATNNLLYGAEIEDLLTTYSIEAQELFTLKYDNSTNNPIAGLETGHYYIFKCIDNQTIMLNDTSIKITDIPIGSKHTFERNNNWIIEIFNYDPIIKGSLVKAGLFISYYTDKKTKGSISNDSLQADTGIGGMKITNNVVNPFNISSQVLLNSNDHFNNSEAYVANNPVIVGAQVVIKFKNPTSNIKTIHVFNSFGILVANQTHNALDNNELILKSLSNPGLYFIQINEGNAVINLKLVVQ